MGPVLRSVGPVGSDGASVAECGRRGCDRASVEECGRRGCDRASVAECGPRGCDGAAVLRRVSHVECDGPMRYISRSFDKYCNFTNMYVAVLFIIF